MTLLITFLSVVAGLAAVCFEYPFTGRHAGPEGSPQETALAFDLLAVFFLALFGTGRSLYTLFRMHARAAELGQWSSLLFLHIILLVPMLLLPFPFLRPATVLTATLAAFSIREILRRSRPSA